LIERYLGKVQIHTILLSRALIIMGIQNFFFALLVFLVAMKRVQSIQVQEDEDDDTARFTIDMNNTSLNSFLGGEWFISYLTNDCPSCDCLSPIIDNLAKAPELKHVKFAKVYLFPRDEEDQDYPLMYHINDGFVRQYERDDFSFDELKLFLTDSEAWDKESEFISKPECAESNPKDFSGDFFNLVRGTLALGALILLFAWLVDVCTAPHPNNLEIEEIDNANEVNVTQQDTGEVVDDNADIDADISIATDSVDIDTVEVKDSNTIENFGTDLDINAGTADENSGTAIEHNDIDNNDQCPTSSRCTKLVSSNPFEESNISLLDPKGSVDKLIGVVQESVIIEPVLQVVTQVCEMQATKVEAEKAKCCFLDDLNEDDTQTSTTGSNQIAKPIFMQDGKPKAQRIKRSIKRCNFKNCHQVNRAEEKESNVAEDVDVNAIKTYKADIVEIEQQEMLTAVAFDIKRQCKQETILLEPVVQETIYLHPATQNSDDSQPEADHKLKDESKC